MINTFIYLMNAYFYQNWWAEYSAPKVNDADVIIHFASKENLEIRNSLVQELEYILENNLAERIFASNSFDFDQVLNGYISEQAWVESAYRIISLRIN